MPPSVLIYILYVYARKTSAFMFFNTKRKKIVLIICSFKAESVLLPCYSFPYLPESNVRACYGLKI